MTKKSLSKKKRIEEITNKKKIVNSLYKDGYSLGKICRDSCLDISSVLILLKTDKFKKKSLYKIYDKQNFRNSSQNIDLISKKECLLIEKFFPNSETNYISSGFYNFWNNKHKQTTSIRDKCTHKYRHIKCASCGKILKDVSHIPLDDDTLDSNTTL